MSSDFEKRPIADFGRKLAHLEGILGAYLPRHVFDGDVQQKRIDCNKSAFSRLRSGKRQAANWELGRFIELFDLGRYGFDYRLFVSAFDVFEADLKHAGVGSYGSTAAHRLRETLRHEVDETARIAIIRDRRLGAGGIGISDEDTELLCLSNRDKVALKVPIKPQNAATDYLLLLHDFPGGRATSCLMPSVFAPDQQLTAPTLRLPQVKSNVLSFPVGGVGGYRCLYGIQSAVDLAAYIGLVDATNTVPDILDHQVTMLVDYLANMSAQERAQTYVSFGEYLLK